MNTSSRFSHVIIPQTHKSPFMSNLAFLLIQKLAKSFNVVKIPLNVPPGEKCFWHWQYACFCAFVQNIMKIIHQLTKIQAFSRTVKLCLLSRVMLSGVQGQIMPKFTGTPCLKIPMMIHRVGTWPLAMASYMSRFQPLGVSSLPAWLTSGLSPTFLACILTEIRLSTPHALAMSHEPPPTPKRPFLKSPILLPIKFWGQILCTWNCFFTSIFIY